MATAGTHQLTVDVPSPVGTTTIRDFSSSTSLYWLPAGYSWHNGSWNLRSDLFVEIQASSGQMLAVTYLTLQEHGVGASLGSAIADLLTSLSDYYESLLSRQVKLAPEAQDDLEKLRRLIEPTSSR
jgi:hypothetical protein